MANVKDLLVNGSARVIGTIYGNATSANKVNHSLTFGSKSFNGSSAQTITLADLGGKPTQSAVSSPSASGTEISFIDTISQNANGVITATKKTVRDASASQSGVVNTGAQTFAGIKTFKDPVYIGSDPNGRGKNYIAFYGITGDQPGNFNHAYIGENLWNSTECSELVLFKGNDIGIDAGTASNPGPDRIRHIAAAHLFQTYASALSGTFSDICTSTVPTNIFAINNTNTKHYVDALPATNNTRTLGSASLRWKALLVGTADSYGSATVPVYWNNGVPTAITSYSGNAATATKATQDSDGNTINSTYLKKRSLVETSQTSVTSGSSAGTSSALILYGTTYGNDAAYLKTSGKMSYGDPGPQIQFSSVLSGGQRGALIFTDHDTIGTGVSLSLVSTESDAWFIAPHIKALTGFVGNLSGNASTATTATNLAAAGTWTWSNGTTSGPTASLVLGGKTTSIGAIPAASSSISGIITTGTQSIAGEKTFTSNLIIKRNTPNLYITDTSTGVDTYSIIRMGSTNAAGTTNTNAAYIFLNGPQRTNDGGNNLLTIRNNVGNLRLNNNTINTGKLTIGQESLNTSYTQYVNGTIGNPNGLVSFVQNNLTIVNTTDFNTLTIPGCYKVQMSNWGAADTYHSPNQWGSIYSFGLLLVFRGAASDGEQRIHQIYFPHQTAGNQPILNRMHNGSDINSGWQNWTRMARDCPTLTGTGATGTWGISITGNASSATKLQTARTIWGQSFNGTANISGNMTGVGNINTAAAPAGTVYMNNWFRSTGATGWYNETYGGGWRMTDSTYIRSFNNKTVRVDNLCLGADNNSYRLYVNGTSYFNGNTTHNGIDYFANGTTYYINNSADANLRRGLFAGTSNADTAASNFYNTGALEIREAGRVGSAQSSFNFAPRIGFHWSGRIAASLSFHSDGIFYFRKQNGNDRATIDANLNGNAGTATKLATARTIWGQSFDGTANITGNFSMSGGDQINMTGANWDGFAFNYNANKKDSNGNAIGQSTRFYDGKTVEIVRFTAGGSVGIGTASPGYKLHVNGNGCFESRIYAHEWIEFNGDRGLYWPSGNYHFYPCTGTTYGSFGLRGTRGGYHGITMGFDDNYMTVMDSGVHKGLYQTSQGMWMFYYNRDSQRVGLRTSSLTSYAVTCQGDLYCRDGWLRTDGSRGWYNESYGGGWYMTDSTYLRSYNNKMVYSGGKFLSPSTASSWIDGQRYARGGYNLEDATDNGAYWPWMRQTNSNTGKWFSFGTLGTSFFWIGSSTSRTDNGYDYGMQFNIANGYLTGCSRVYSAVWNDYAEYRKSDVTEPGRVVIENGDGTLSLSTKRLQRGAEVISDTFGFAIGETDECKTPIAATGRVLAYTYESIEEYRSKTGWPVCSGPNGTVSIMTEEEEEKYPSRIIGTISEVPDYEEWGTGKVKTNGRVWIRIK